MGSHNQCNNVVAKQCSDDTCQDSTGGNVQILIYLAVIQTWLYFSDTTNFNIMYKNMQAHYILDEMLMNGAIVETNKQNILAPIHLLEKAS